VEESRSGFRSAPALGDGKKQQGGLPGQAKWYALKGAG